MLIKLNDHLVNPDLIVHANICTSKDMAGRITEKLYISLSNDSWIYVECKDREEAESLFDKLERLSFVVNGEK